VTEKSIAHFLYKDTLNRPLDQVRLDQAARAHLITVGEDADLKTCAQIMLDKNISSLIVIDNVGNLHGIFTKSDLVDVYAKHYAGKNLVEDYMTTKVLTVTPDHSIHTVIALMIRNRVSRIVVVRGQKPIGIVTSRDLIPISTLIEAEVRDMPSEVEISRRQTTSPLSTISHVLLARDVMRRELVTITGDSDLAEAAQIMTNRRISGIPVVDSDNNLLGIITKTDVVRALTA
jgi:CBS domain-containing protein